MPLYEYQCAACGEVFEHIQKFSDPLLDVCRKCGKGPVKKLQSSPAFQFKGSGFYITDYAKKTETSAKGDKGEAGSKGEAGKGKGEKSEKRDSASKTESTKTEPVKTESTKTESKSDTPATKTDKKPA